MYWKLQISHVKFKDYQREKYMNQIFEKKKELVKIFV